MSGYRFLIKLRNTNSWLRLSRFAKNKTKKTDIKKTVIKKEKKSINKHIIVTIPYIISQQ